MHIVIFSVYYGSGSGQCAGCPLSFETGGTMGYNCCFFLNFVPLHIKSPYNFGGTGPILGVKTPLQRVNGHADVYECMSAHRLLFGEIAL